MKNVYPLKCQIRAEAGVTRVDVYDDIGEGGWFSEGLTAKGFAAQLAGVKGGLEVHINSGGGDVFDGIAIGNAIRGHKGPVTTVVDGLAASIASVIAQAGQERVVQPGSMMMIHDAFGMCVGDAGEMTAMAATLDKVSDNIAAVYADRSGGDAEGWRAVMKDETWYTAEEAVKAGLADRVGDGEAELPAGLDVAAYEVPGRIAAALRSLPVAAAKGACCPQCGPDCSCAAAQDHLTTKDVLALIRHELQAAQGVPGSHGDHERFDPDGDGDCDACPEGDTDHDYWSADGTQLKPVPGKPMTDHFGHVIVAAAVDEGSWDGPAAMSRASKSDNPQSSFRAICAGEKTTGEPDTQAHWALPHHASPGDPPNRSGVTAALGRLNQTQDLKNKAAAEAHLQAHQNAMGGGSSEDHHHAGLNWAPDAFLTALTREVR